MSDVSTSQTHVSLLLRIRENDRDPEAWNAFVNRYGRRIYEWCLNRKLQPADAEDVTQNVLIKLSRQMGSFEYQSNLTFRGWLRRITENAITDFFRELRAEKRASEIQAELDQLDSAVAQADLTTRLCDEFDLEILDIAKQRVKQRIEPQRWKAWEQISIEQKSGQEVADELGMLVPTVYSSRYQVQKMIAAEVEKLQECSEQIFRLNS